MLDSPVLDGTPPGFLGSPQKRRGMPRRIATSRHCIPPALIQTPIVGSGRLESHSATAREPTPTS